MGSTNSTKRSSINIRLPTQPIYYRCEHCDKQFRFKIHKIIHQSFCNGYQYVNYIRI